MRRSDYRTCPHCGANLDPCERCDCAKEGSTAGTVLPSSHGVKIIIQIISENPENVNVVQGEKFQ